MGAEPANIDVDTEALGGAVRRLRAHAAEMRRTAGRIGAPPTVPVTAGPEDGSAETGVDDGAADADEVSAALRRCAASVAAAVAERADVHEDRAAAADAAGRVLAESDASAARGFAAIEDGLR